MGILDAIPSLPATVPDAGIGVNSSTQGTSLVLPVFSASPCVGAVAGVAPWTCGVASALFISIPAWCWLWSIESGIGATPHLPAGNWLHACTIRSPQMPAHAIPEIQKNSSNTDIQLPNVAWMVRMNERFFLLFTASLGISMALSDLRFCHHRYQPVRIIKIVNEAVVSWI